MVMDQAGWHLAGELVVPANMRLIFLPPYSPELNPAPSVIWTRPGETDTQASLQVRLEAAGRYELSVLDAGGQTARVEFQVND